MGVISLLVAAAFSSSIVLFYPSLTSATQALSQRPAGASAAAAPVRTMTQYKYAAGVRNPQQHMASQPQVTMQQVICCPLYSRYLF